MEIIHQRTLIPDPHDERDHQFCDIHGENASEFCQLTCRIKIQEKLASYTLSQVDLRPQLTSEIINQGLLNSCSACAIAVASELYLIKDQQPFIDENASNIDASQMFVYYNERVMEDKVDINAPVYIRNGIKSLFKHGICSEKSWPYPEMMLPESLKTVVANGTMEEMQQELTRVMTEHQAEIQAAIKEKPSKAAVTQAKKHIINRYCKLNEEDDLAELRLALSKGLPVIFGMMVPKSFYAIGSDGVMTMPDTDEPRLGGHALLAVGYDDDRKVFIVRNSWGEEFGDKGYCYMPYEFFSSGYISNGKNQENTFSYWCLTHE
ncbi:C1 family peptidase [Colwellia sp. 1_MG-2023]|uniref:C1 family peptidase n=1 Tax=Colwellia sp. 1_MG-2023 TaxID=3062649 RepID=UPI0026E14DFF|nr:C1 family peptidase [Colwellia sp. 1_MG-2023]MDO6445915.1 C1 family peptidase [Colwellia sp. 1_MG-2023]